MVNIHSYTYSYTVEYSTSTEKNDAGYYILDERKIGENSVYSITSAHNTPVWIAPASLEGNLDKDSSTPDGSKILYYINYARLYLNNDAADEYIPQAAGFLIIYIVLVVYTCMFAIRYMKRVIYIAFLTMIAPLVALTYPLDKIKDGKAQAFNMWFREYIFNVLIQPFHLILYTVLVGSAMNLVTASPIYAIVAIAFLVPAEKLLRKFFGFDNAGTLSAAGSFAGGALFTAMINKINKPKPKDGEDREKPQNRKTSSNQLSSGEIYRNYGATGDVANRSVEKGKKDSGSRDGQENREASNEEDEQLDGQQTFRGYFDESKSGEEKQTDNNKQPEIKKYKNEEEKRKDNESTDWMKPVKMSRFNRLMNAPGTALGDAGRSMLYRYKRKALKGARTLPRKFAGALVGGSLATIGAGVGLASGDPSKAIQYAMAGGAAGYSGTNYVANKMGREIKEASKDADAAFFGSDLKARNQYLYDKEWKKNPENINKLANALGSRDAAKKAIKDNSVQAFLNSNVVDPSKVGKALKLRDKFVREKGMDSTEALKRAVLIAQWNRDSGKGIYEKNSRAQQVWKEQTARQFRERGMDESTATKAVEDILNNMEYLEF